MSTIEQEIQHLDFPTNNQEKEKESHYSHPIEPHLYWCGKPKNKITPRPGQGTSVEPSDITCADCLHLFIEKGQDWWWKVNKAWYGD